MPALSMSAILEGAADRSACCTLHEALPRISLWSPRESVNQFLHCPRDRSQAENYMEVLPAGRNHAYVMTTLSRYRPVPVAGRAAVLLMFDWARWAVLTAAWPLRLSSGTGSFRLLVTCRTADGSGMPDLKAASPVDNKGARLTSGNIR